jgi:hypothetical protein
MLVSQADDREHTMMSYYSTHCSYCGSTHHLSENHPEPVPDSDIQYLMDRADDKDDMLTTKERSEAQALLMWTYGIDY